MSHWAQRAGGTEFLGEPDPNWDISAPHSYISPYGEVLGVDFGRLPKSRAGTARRMLRVQGAQGTSCVIGRRMKREVMGSVLLWLPWAGGNEHTPPMSIR